MKTAIRIAMRTGAAALTVLAVLLPGLTGGAASSTAAGASVSVFPISGSRVAPPHAQISFRGIAPDQIGTITVTGSRSGQHSGTLKPHSDGQGASFVPGRAFRSGEVVTVKTGLNIVGGQSGTFHFTVATPAGRLPNRPFASSVRVRGDVLHFRSRPDLAPTAVRITHRGSHTAPGDIFLAAEYGPVQSGPMVIDGNGNLVWFKAVPKYNLAADVRVQTYEGRPVLTWWQGYFGAGVGSGVDVINDQAYHQIAVVRAGNGLTADLHEFKLTSRGTALVAAVYPVRWDASSIHKSKNAIVFDGVVQEIDIKTGLVEYQWDSLDHIPLSATYTTFPPHTGAPFDYFHLNSIDEDRDGNLLVSARSTSAMYKIDHSNGRVIWTLGGRYSTFKLGPGAATAFQHDARVQSTGDSRITVFDNGAGLYKVHSQSRGLIVGLDLRHKTARKIGEFDHSPHLLAAFEGNVQPLPNGNTFIGWGQQPYFSEYNSRGQTLFDGRFVDTNASYRAYRFPWVGMPQTRPSVAASGTGSQSTVYVSWNGDNRVAQWRVLAGTTSTSLTPVTTAATSGFETTIHVKGAPYFAVQGLDGHGQVLGQSAAVRSR
jgi:hypothetical protein